ncbi:MAG TPA: DNA topoisomerase I [Nitrososphaeraceae archaeon]|nr:DNA topoisomerase I [Nitrososphaeraceae archaeon]
MKLKTEVALRKWTTLEHRGVAFPPNYQIRGLKISIAGERHPLSHEQEELVYSWSKKKDTHYIKDPVFQANFLSDFKKLLPERFQNISRLTEIDFSEAFALIDQEKMMKEAEMERIRNLPKDEKKKIRLAKKSEIDRLKGLYGKAIVDGVEVDVANWLVEPPGLFMGRGQHPLRGRWKPRVTPSDVILNLGEEAPVPEGNWKGVIHDHSSTWLATWIEKLTGRRKYVWLHDSSSLRQNSDREKYDKANRLERHIGRVQREIINRMLKSRDVNQRKTSTVCYLIFKLAMRVGDEKDPEEADTVGASTLRVEHITFKEDKDGGKLIEFNFLGKDSVPWQKIVKVTSEDTIGLYNNLKKLIQGKERTSQIFEGITSSKVNAFLRSIDSKNLPGLTAKVFRTFITTNVVRETLAKPPFNRIDKMSSEAEKIYAVKIANLNAAITCNHKKGIDPKNPASVKAIQKFNDSVAKKEETIEKLRSELDSDRSKTESQVKRIKDRLERIELQLKLQKETRDYNLGTSLRNYIDPRVIAAWLLYVDLDWKKVYTATLQRKFRWVEEYDPEELKLFYPLQKQVGNEVMKVVVSEESSST